jgi:hypothetical protein
MLAVTVYFTTRVYWVSLALVVFLLFLVPDFASSGRFLGFFFLASCNRTIVFLYLLTCSTKGCVTYVALRVLLTFSICYSNLRPTGALEICVINQTDKRRLLQWLLSDACVIIFQANPVLGLRVLSSLF